MPENNEPMLEKAREVGRLIGQTTEYRTLKRAREQVSDDRELTELINGIGELEGELRNALQRGEEPSDEERQEYEEAFSKLQGSSLYQSLVAAQSNFDKLLKRVNEAMGQGMESGAGSSIIYPS